MTSPESIALIRRARDGDRMAWEAICTHYYPKWLDQLHGEIGHDLRHLCETVDLIQSAVGSAVHGIADLRDDGAFFAWVTAIALKKLFEQRRRIRKRRKVPLGHWDQIPDTKTCIESKLLEEEGCERMLDTILALFPKHTDQMTAVYLKYYHKQPISSLVKVFDKSERTVERLLRQGLELLRQKLPTHEGKRR